jgi:hypothetical protein
MLALTEDSATVDLGRCSTPTNLWDVHVKNVQVAHFRGGAVDWTTKKFGPSRHRRCLHETLMRCAASKQMFLASSSTEGQNAGNIRFSVASVKCANALSAPIMTNRDRILTNLATVCLMSGVPALVRD